jgi:hypothetical protein
MPRKASAPRSVNQTDCARADNSFMTAFLAAASGLVMEASLKKMTYTVSG